MFDIHDDSFGSTSFSGMPATGNGALDYQVAGCVAMLFDLGP
jgi:hypothetical protein